MKQFYAVMSVNWFYDMNRTAGTFTLTVDLES